MQATTISTSKETKNKYDFKFKHFFLIHLHQLKKKGKKKKEKSVSIFTFPNHTFEISFHKYLQGTIIPYKKQNSSKAGEGGGGQLPRFQSPNF